METFGSLAEMRLGRGAVAFAAGARKIEKSASLASLAQFCVLSHHLVESAERVAINSTALENFTRLLDEPASADVVFMVEGKPLHAHRCILTLASVCFERMFEIGRASPNAGGACTQRSHSWCPCARHCISPVCYTRSARANALHVLMLRVQRIFSLYLRTAASVVCPVPLVGAAFLSP